MPTGTRVDPYRLFRFRVEIDGITIAGFSEASIPDSSTDPIEYREGIDPPSQRKLSGLNKFGTVTLKKGITDNMDLYNWRKLVEQSGATKARKSISLVLIDEEGNDKARWNILDAWPSKYDPSDFNAKSNEVLLETFEITHEGVSRVA